MNTPVQSGVNRLDPSKENKQPRFEVLTIVMYVIQNPFVLLNERTPIVCNPISIVINNASLSIDSFFILKKDSNNTMRIVWIQALLLIRR